MNRFRGVLIRWEKKVENYLGSLHLACAWITHRAAGLLGLALRSLDKLRPTSCILMKSTQSHFLNDHTFQCNCFEGTLEEIFLVE